MNNAARRRIDCYFPAVRPTYHCHPRDEHDFEATASHRRCPSVAALDIYILYYNIIHYLHIYYMTDEEEDPKTELYINAHHVLRRKCI